MEAKRLRDKLGSKLLVVTPGIRPGVNLYDEQDDQQRIVTARQAIADGVDYLVIGRPISKAADPIEVISSLQEEIKMGLSS
jgi:orotidine-5'-phosphate decarboxylase